MRPSGCTGRGTEETNPDNSNYRMQIRPRTCEAPHGALFGQSRRKRRHPARLLSFRGAPHYGLHDARFRCERARCDNPADRVAAGGAGVGAGRLRRCGGGRRGPRPGARAVRHLSHRRIRPRCSAPTRAASIWGTAMAARAVRAPRRRCAARACCRPLAAGLSAASPAPGRSRSSSPDVLRKRCPSCCWPCCSTRWRARTWAATTRRA